MAAPKTLHPLSPVRGGASQGEATGIPTQGRCISQVAFSHQREKIPTQTGYSKKGRLCRKRPGGACIRCSNNATLLLGRFPNHLGADPPTAQGDTPMQHTLSQELPESPGPTSHWLEWVSGSWDAAWSHRLKSSPCHAMWDPKGKQHCPRSFPRTLHQLVRGTGGDMRSLGLGGGSVQSARCPGHV